MLKDLISTKYWYQRSKEQLELRNRAIDSGHHDRLASFKPLYVGQVAGGCTIKGLRGWQKKEQRNKKREWRGLMHLILKPRGLTHKTVWSTAAGKELFHRTKPIRFTWDLDSFICLHHRPAILGVCIFVSIENPLEKIAVIKIRVEGIVRFSVKLVIGCPHLQEVTQRCTDKCVGILSLCITLLCFESRCDLVRGLRSVTFLDSRRWISASTWIPARGAPWAVMRSVARTKQCGGHRSPW